MNAWVVVAAAVGLCLIAVLLIGTRRPRTIQAELDRHPKAVTSRQTGPPAQLDRSGALAETPIRSLLVTINTSRATGTLTLTRNDQLCSLCFLYGHLFHATCGGFEGEQAVQAALSWSDGTYAFDTRAKLPTVETVTRPTDLLLAAEESFPLPMSSPRSPESVDWAGLLKQMQQLADAALGDRSKKVNEILGAAQPGRESVIQAIDRIANMSLMFVDPARLESLAGRCAGCSTNLLVEVPRGRSK